MPRALTRLSLAHRGWRYASRVDPDEIEWMRGILRPGDVVVDAGAYKGGYTYWMRRCVGPSGRVFAFEPQPEMAAYLSGCVEAFAWSNVSVVRAALSAEPGRRQLRRPPGDPSPAASLVGASLQPGAVGVEVRVDALDVFLREHAPGERIAFLKCDVEGHELDVLRGARTTLARDLPAILVECEARHLAGATMTDVFDYIEALGYRGSFFWKGRRNDLDAFDEDVHQVEGRRPYANNFVFEAVGPP